MPNVSGETRTQNSNAAVTEITPSSDTAAALGSRGDNSPTAQQATPLDPAAATQAWLDSVPKEKREKSDAYFEGGYWLILWNFLLAAGDLDFSAGFPNLGAAARFFGTTNQVRRRCK